MENKINALRESIKRNPNFTEEFKCSLGTLTDALVSTLPDYDYTNFEMVLSTIKLSQDNNLQGYSLYDIPNNELKLNTNDIFEDRIDLEHLFLQRLLSISTHKEEQRENKGYYDGLSEKIASLVIPDESFKKIDVLESESVSMLSRVVDPTVLIDSYMKDDISLVLENISENGISEEQFKILVSNINALSTQNERFITIQKQIIDMYGMRLQNDILKGITSKKDIDLKYNEFASSLINSKEELVSLYPKYDFERIKSLKGNKDYLEKEKEKMKQSKLEPELEVFTI